MRAEDLHSRSVDRLPAVREYRDVGALHSHSRQYCDTNSSTGHNIIGSSGIRNVGCSPDVFWFLVGKYPKLQIRGDKLSLAKDWLQDGIC